MSGKNLRGIALASGAVVLGLGCLLVNGAPSWRGSPQANAAAPAASAPALPVPVAAVVKKSVPIYLDYVGTTEAIRSVMLQAKVTGYLAERGPADGADVKQGDLLYRIDPRDYQAALDQVTAQAARDAAALDYSRSTQGRNAALAKEGWTSKETYEQTTSSLRQSEASLSADQAAIRAAKLNIAYTEIRAPFDGRREPSSTRWCSSTPFMRPSTPASAISPPSRRAVAQATSKRRSISRATASRTISGR
jgi:multidrug efflux system membrane fusion protein